MKMRHFGLVWRAGLLILFFLLIGWLTWRCSPHFAALINNPEVFYGYIENMGHYQAPFFIFLQIFQVIVAPLPGEVVQIASGYVFNATLGTLYCLIGTLIGSVIVFSLARQLGMPLLKHVISPRQFEDFYYLINQPRSEGILFVLFLIPGFPKDILTFLSGITPINWFKFLAIAMVGRFPGILLSAMIGSNFQQKNYYFSIVLSFLAVLVFLLGYIYRKSIIKFFHHHQKKDPAK